MNVRKPVDYSAMFGALDTLMAADVPQMELYCEIGRLVSGRTEKGATVATAEYLCSTYPDVSGFSPRNLRRMREFYRTYENNPEVLAEAMTIGWTQNVVILEAELSIQTLKLSIDGEVCNPYGDPVYIKESCQVSRTPPAVVRTQQNGTSQVIEPPPQILARDSGYGIGV